MTTTLSFKIRALLIGILLGAWLGSGCRQRIEIPPAPESPAQKLIKQRKGLPGSAKQGKSKDQKKTSESNNLVSLRGKTLQVETPPTWGNKAYYPCRACHTGSPNRTRRKLVRSHQNLTLRHGANHIWCYHCHSSKNPNQLRLADETIISYKKSYLLCFQCHGDKTRDWLDGIHGRLTGKWNGPKRYLLCTHCHNPHNPKPSAFKPMPPPIPPAKLQRRKR